MKILTEHSDTGLSGNGEKNDKDDQVKDGKHDHRPYKQAKFSLEGPLLDLGCYRREDRKYTPHVTLGRVKSERPADKLAAALAKNAGWKGGDTSVHEVHVMSSQLGPKGPVYMILSRAKLA